VVAMFAAGPAEVRSGLAAQKHVASRSIHDHTTRAWIGLPSIESITALQTNIQQLSASDADERQRGALSLRTIAAESTENQMEAVHSGAVIPLVRLLQDDDPGVREEAARGLWSLARGRHEINAGVQRAIAEAGAIAPLVELLRDEIQRLRVVSASLLNDLAIDNPRNREEIALSGAVPTLVQLLSDDAGSAFAASSLLQGLASGIASKQVAAALIEAVNPLVDLLRTGNRLAQEEAVTTLAALAASGSDVQRTVAKSGAPRLIVKCLHLEQPMGWTVSPAQGSGTRMHSTAALALRNLAAGSAENQGLITQAGAISPLVHLLAVDAPDVRDQAVRTLLSLDPVERASA